MTSPFQFFKIRAYFLFLLSILLTQSTAHALDFSLIAPLTYSNYSVAEGIPSVSSTGKVGGGLGVTLGVGFFPFLSFETGLLNITHTFVNHVSIPSTNLTINQAYSYHYWQVPFLVRFTPIEAISIQAGAYYSKSISISAQSSQPVVLSLNQPALADDFGILAGVGYRKKLSPFVKLRADLMYEYGLKKLPTGVDARLNTRSLDLWLGLMLDLI